MDPLSMTASIITLLAVGGNVFGGLERLSSLREVPDSVLALRNEISDFRLVSLELAKHLQDLSAKPPEITQTLSINVLPILDRTRNTIMELEALIKNKLIIPRKDGTIRLNKAAWILERHKLKRLQDEVRSMRISLIAVMNILTLKCMLRPEVHIPPLRSTTGQFYGELSQDRAIATSNSSTTESLLAEISKMVSHIQSRIESDTHTVSSVSLSQPSGPQRIVTVQEQRGREIPTVKRHSHPHNLQNPSVVSRRHIACATSCACRCHDRVTWRSPMCIGSLLGRLFVEHAGLPILAPPCDKSDCQWNFKLCMTIQYLFPSWFAQWALYACSRLCYHGIQHTFRVSRAVWSGSKIFWQARLGDVDGIRTLLASREASPYDVSSECGATALNVRPIGYCLPLYLV